jgi:hypothetical protein
VELKDSQAALILETSDEGEISVEVAAADMDGLASQLCQHIARKLIGDEAFQQELMAMLNQE